jgi:Putative DNA-binding domain
MSSKKNTWTIERLSSYIGREESAHLEFKSSLPLTTGKDTDINRFFNEKLSPALSAFINTEGGILIVGIEEERSGGDRDLAKALSKGVPRSAMTGIMFSNKLLDRIHPATGSFVTVHTVDVGRSETGDLLAFVIEIKPGITAYQAQDKKYYCRRGYDNIAMDDKDIRLRMLTDDRPRVLIQPSIPTFFINADTGYSLDKLKIEISKAIEIDRAVEARREALGEEEYNKELSLKLLAGEVQVRSRPWQYLKDKSVTASIPIVIENAGNVSIHRGAIKKKLVIGDAPHTVKWLSPWNPTTPFHLSEELEPFEFGGPPDSAHARPLATGQSD